MKNTVLVIGGNGFIGYSVIKELVQRQLNVKCLDQNRSEEQFKLNDVEYCIGDIWDSSFLRKVLNGVDCVMDFMSTSMPNTNEISLSNEINNTLRYHDYILSLLKLCNVKKYIFPSSGGAIYGNKESGLAYETDILRPTTPYGAGKKMAEEIIQYYYEKCGITSYILRIGNVYGSPRLRSKSQGVIDIFIQNALLGETISIWGNAKLAIRDYIYLGDVAKAIVDVSQKDFNELKVYNVGTGVGTNLAQIIELIAEILGREIRLKYRETMASGINSIVLSNDKIKKEIGWFPRVSLDEGIQKTIDIKRALLGL